MIIRSKAPLRLGFAGGGTDLTSFSRKFGGAVLNSTISMYAHCTIIPTDDDKIKFYAYDNQNDLEIDSVESIPIEDEKLILHKGVYNRIVKDFNGGKRLSFTMYTSNDAPIGSGLGTSSTMVVAILEAFLKWLNIDLNDYDKAWLAYDIERNDLGLKGGMQDQYCAVFGGFNFMEFERDGSVKVNPLPLSRITVNELESSLLLYYNGRSRSSAQIISEQINNTASANQKTMEAMHSIKRTAFEMRDCILAGDFELFSKILLDAWENKKRTSNIVSNPEIDKISKYFFDNNAKAIKLSGAGGGGFMMINFDPVYRQRIIDSTKVLAGKVFPVKFQTAGVESWIIDRQA